jgi:DNA-binding CsgD family transcriptional regulator
MRLKYLPLRINPKLVADWLGISLHEHSLGLTSSQWQYFYQKLSQEQRELIKLLTAKKTVEDISQQLGWKPSKIYNEWTQLYLEAQALRND